MLGPVGQAQIAVSHGSLRVICFLTSSHEFGVPVGHSFERVVFIVLLLFPPLGGGYNVHVLVRWGWRGRLAAALVRTGT